MTCDPVRGEQLHLRGQEAGAGAVDDLPVAVASEQQALEGGVQPVGEVHRRPRAGAGWAAGRAGGRGRRGGRRTAGGC